MNRFLISVICALGMVHADSAWSQDLVTVALDEALVFSAPNGDVVNVAPGQYVVALAEADALSLMPTEGEALIVSATRGEHEIDLAEPVAQLIAGDDELTTHVVLMLPDGTYAGAVGSRGGVLSRGIDPFTQQRLYFIAIGLIPAYPVPANLPNVARRKPAKQISRYSSGYASRAVDGNEKSNWSARTMSHTGNETNPWWEVDLGAQYDIRKIEIWNRTDPGYGKRLDKLTITISDKSGAAGQAFFGGLRRYSPTAKNPLTIYGTKTGRFVRVKLQATNYLALAEVKVYGTKSSPPPIVSGGWWHSCALASGQVKCWGYNWADPPSGANFTAVSAGQKHTCGLQANGSVRCWGNNEFAQSSPPVNVKFTSLSVGGYFACGVREIDSEVQCWGNNNDGQLNAPNGVKFLSVAAGSNHACGIRKSDAMAQCWGFRQYIGQRNPPRGVAFTSLGAGSSFNCGVRWSDEMVQCWGTRSYGKTSSPSGVRFSSISVGLHHTCGIRKNDGQAQCWGVNYEGAASPPNGVTFTALGAGNAHTCGIRKSDGKAQCWGWNEQGVSSPPQ